MRQFFVLNCNLYFKNELELTQILKMIITFQWESTSMIFISFTTTLSTSTWQHNFFSFFWLPFHTLNWKFNVLSDFIFLSSVFSGIYCNSLEQVCRSEESYWKKMEIAFQLQSSCMWWTVSDEKGLDIVCPLRSGKWRGRKTVKIYCKVFSPMKHT